MTNEEALQWLDDRLDAEFSANETGIFLGAVLIISTLKVNGITRYVVHGMRGAPNLLAWRSSSCQSPHSVSGSDRPGASTQSRTTKRMPSMEAALDEVFRTYPDLHRDPVDMITRVGKEK